MKQKLPQLGQKTAGLGGPKRRKKVERGSCFGFSPGSHVSCVMSWGWQRQTGSCKQLGDPPSREREHIQVPGFPQADDEGPSQ